MQTQSCGPHVCCGFHSNLLCVSCTKCNKNTVLHFPHIRIMLLFFCCERQYANPLLVEEQWNDTQRRRRHCDEYMSHHTLTQQCLPNPSTQFFSTPTVRPSGSGPATRCAIRSRAHDCIFLLDGVGHIVLWWCSCEWRRCFLCNFFPHDDTNTLTDT